MDGGGTIDLTELLTIIELERTPFTERVFSIFDEDNSGKIDFGEFVLALWNFCTLTKTTLGTSIYMSLLLCLLSFDSLSEYSHILVRAL